MPGAPWPIVQQIIDELLELPEAIAQAAGLEMTQFLKAIPHLAGAYPPAEHSVERLGRHDAYLRPERAGQRDQVLTGPVVAVERDHDRALGLLLRSHDAVDELAAAHG